MSVSKQELKQVQPIIENIALAMRTEGTSGNPRKFTLLEIAQRVELAFLVSPNDKLQDVVLSSVTDALRDLGRIKKEKSDYNFAQTLISYRVLNNVDINALIGSLYSKGSYSIELTEEETKQFRECVNVPSESSKQYTLTKGHSGESCSFSPNYGSIKKK